MAVTVEDGPGGMLVTRGATVEVAFRVRGDGPAVVLLHGTSANHAVWEPVVDRLQPHARVISLDQRGHGRSGKPASGYRGPDFAGDVVTVLDALGIDRALVAGHSLGARNAWLTGALFPERVTGVLAVDYTPWVEPSVLDDLLVRVEAGNRSFDTVDDVRRAPGVLFQARTRILRVPVARPTGRGLVVREHEVLQLQRAVERGEVRRLQQWSERAMLAVGSGVEEGVPLRRQRTLVRRSRRPAATGAALQHGYDRGRHARQRVRDAGAQTGEIAEGERDQQVPGTVLCDLPSKGALDEHAVIVRAGGDTEQGDFRRAQRRRSSSAISRSTVRWFRAVATGPTRRQNARGTVDFETPSGLHW